MGRALCVGLIQPFRGRRLNARSPSPRVRGWRRDTLDWTGAAIPWAGLSRPFGAADWRARVGKTMELWLAQERGGRIDQIIGLLDAGRRPRRTARARHSSAER